MADAAVAAPAGTASAPVASLPVALVLMAASGFAGLAYQITWTQQSTIWLGHESTAVLAVVAAFFAGLAVGAFTLGRRIDASVRPARWYAACEAVIAGWGLVLVFLVPQAGEALLALMGDRPGALWQSAVAFTGTFLLLLPATAAMGGTLPALERTLARTHPGARTLAALYAANTLGAVAGVLAATFWLVPQHGLVNTTLVCVVCNLLCAAATPWLSRLAAAAPATPASSTTALHTPRTPERHDAGRSALPLLAWTGLLGIGYEVLVVRVLRQVAENTVYTFAMLLAVYLVGTALGAAAHHRWRARSVPPQRSEPVLFMAQALACLLGTASLWGAAPLKTALLAMSGGGIGFALAAEAVLAAVAFLLPTLVMGAVFSQLCTRAVDAGRGFGQALAVNTLGAAAAPLVFGVGLATALGPKAALLVVVAGYLLLAAWSGRRATDGHALPLWGLAGTTAALALLAPPLVIVDVPEGGRIVSYRDGALGAVSVVEDAHGVATLRIDNRQQEGSNATRYADARQALLPLLLHPAPRSALFLGVGTGVTATAAAQDAQLQVDAVELVPEVIEATAHFTADLGEGSPHRQPTLIAADARRFVRATQQRYDLIVSDNFHPARSGSASLYTVEHFRAVQARLAPGGVFCQWLPLHQLDLATLRSIVRAFNIAQPEGWAVLATLSLETPVIGLVSRAGGGRFDAAALRARLAGIELPTPPAAFGLHDEHAVLGSFIAGPAALARLAADAPANTDDHPVVAYRAPRLTYAPDSTPRERLLALLGELDVAPAEVLQDHGVQLFPGDATSVRLAAYWQARDLFLQAGRDVQPSGDVRRMLAQVREPLLQVLRTSPDFRPAYDPLLHMAVALGERDAPAARLLLAELARLQPARPEAAQALLRLGSTATATTTVGGRP